MPEETGRSAPSFHCPGEYPTISSALAAAGPVQGTVVVAPGQPALYEPGPIELLVRELTERGVARQVR